jgi:hypothetical protein
LKGWKWAFKQKEEVQDAVVEWKNWMRPDQMPMIIKMSEQRKFGEKAKVNEIPTFGFCPKTIILQALQHNGVG